MGAERTHTDKNRSRQFKCQQSMTSWCETSYRLNKSFEIPNLQVADPTAASLGKCCWDKVGHRCKHQQTSTLVRTYILYMWHFCSIDLVHAASKNPSTRYKITAFMGSCGIVTWLLKPMSYWNPLAMLKMQAWINEVLSCLTVSGEEYSQTQEVLILQNMKRPLPQWLMRMLHPGLPHRCLPGTHKEPCFHANTLGSHDCNTMIHTSL